MVETQRSLSHVGRLASLTRPNHFVRRELSRPLALTMQQFDWIAPATPGKHWVACAKTGTLVHAKFINRSSSVTEGGGCRRVKDRRICGRLTKNRKRAKEPLCVRGMERLRHSVQLNVQSGTTWRWGLENRRHCLKSFLGDEVGVRTMLFLANFSTSGAPVQAMEDADPKEEESMLTKANALQGERSARRRRKWWLFAWFPVLDRYLLIEMLRPFVAAVCMFASLGVSLGALVELIREVVVSGLPLRVALGAAVLQAPRFLALVMPLAAMAGVLLGLGRLRTDTELLAMAAAGVPIQRFLVAPLALAMGAALLTLACNELVVPVGSARAREIVQTVLSTELHTLRQRTDVVYSEYGPPEEEDDHYATHTASAMAAPRSQPQERQQHTASFPEAATSVSTQAQMGQSYIAPPASGSLASSPAATSLALGSRNPLSTRASEAEATTYVGLSGGSPVLAADVREGGQGRERREPAAPGMASHNPPQVGGMVNRPFAMPPKATRSNPGPDPKHTNLPQQHIDHPSQVEERRERQLAKRVLRRVWCAQRVEGGHMWGLTVVEMGPDGNVRRVLTAEDCVWDLAERVWLLRGGVVVDVAQDGSVRRMLQVESLEVPMPNAENAAHSTAGDLHELSRGNIHVRIAQLRAKAEEEQEQERAKQGGVGVVGTSPNQPTVAVSPREGPDGGEELSGGGSGRRWLDGAWLGDRKGAATGGLAAAEANRAECLLAQRDAAAFSCVVYALMGAAATLVTAKEQRRSGSRAIPYVYALTGVVLYNLLSSLGSMLGMMGKLAPAWSAWGPSIGGVLFPILVLVYSRMSHIKSWWNWRLDVWFRQNLPAQA